MAEITVSVPDDEGEAALAGADGVVVVRYDPSGALPDAATWAQ